MRIMQTNLNRKRTAMDLVHRKARERKVDIIVASEPNKNKVKSQNWIKDHREDT